MLIDKPDPALDDELCAVILGLDWGLVQTLRRRAADQAALSEEVAGHDKEKGRPRCVVCKDLPELDDVQLSRHDGRVICLGCIRRAHEDPLRRLPRRLLRQVREASASDKPQGSVYDHDPGWGQPTDPNYFGF